MRLVAFLGMKGGEVILDGWRSVGRGLFYGLVVCSWRRRLVTGRN